MAVTPSLAAITESASTPNYNGLFNGIRRRADVGKLRLPGRRAGADSDQLRRAGALPGAEFRGTLGYDDYEAAAKPFVL